MTHIKMGRFHILEMKRPCGFDNPRKTAQGLDDLSLRRFIRHAKNEDILQASMIPSCYNETDREGL